MVGSSDDLRTVRLSAPVIRFSDSVPLSEYGLCLSCEVAGGNVESLGDLHHRQKSRVGLAAFDFLEVADRDAGPVGELFLRQALLKAKLPDRLSEGYAHLVFSPHGGGHSQRRVR